MSTPENASPESLERLQTPDERTLHFMPNGLGIGMMMTPESSAEYWFEVAGRNELHPDVAEGTRQSFDHLRAVLPYGVLSYEIFTLVDDHAMLILEQALRDRFIAYYGGEARFVDGAGNEIMVTAERYSQVADYLVSKVGRGARRLRFGDGPESIYFDGMLKSLLGWARKVGLLRGQRSRGFEQAMTRLRNDVAHPSDYHLQMPPETVRTIKVLAELINQLWGHPTVGGWKYPAPIRREVVALAWNDSGTRRCHTLAENLRTSEAWEEYDNFAIFRSVWSDWPAEIHPQLDLFDSLHETTPYPTELLWGPGTRADAARWLDADEPEPDVCDPLDRTFVIRHDEGNLYLPTRPSAMALLSPDEQAGEWHIVLADHPNDAYGHVRSRVAGQPTCMTSGPCAACSAESVSVGDWQHALTAVGGAPALGLSHSDFRAPRAPARFNAVA